MSSCNTPEAAADPNWNGMPKVLAQNDSVTMPQTPEGSLVLGYFNQSAQDNAGSLMVSSAGQDPISLPVPALVRMISVLVNNWHSNNLTLTNVSDNAATPIFVEAFGPGIPGVQPLQLVVGQPRQLVVPQAAQGVTPPNFMRLRFTASSGDLETLAIVGGPPDETGNNAHVIALNSPSGDTGPPPQDPPPAGYYATRQGNAYEMRFNWGAARVYVVNMSSQTASSVTVLLQKI